VGFAATDEQERNLWAYANYMEVVSFVDCNHDTARNFVHNRPGNRAA
jgi:hypothetical protein